MTQERPQNVAASVRQKLLNRARELREDFQLVLTRYALERLLFRLSQSEHANNFVLKGAFLFLIWTAQPYRPTRDLDLLGFGESSTEILTAIFKQLCRNNHDDGLIFVADSISAEEIRDDSEYDGVRVTLITRLGEAEIPLQIDIGFGDVVVPQPTQGSFPTILDMPAPQLLIYSRESVVAEKYEAMVRLGIANSRMKDFYDVWILTREFDFEGVTICNAIQKTFEKRRAALPESTPLALSREFSQDTSKRNQWQAFSGRIRLRIPADDLESVVHEIHSFLIPPTKALVQGKQFKLHWPAGGPWQKSKKPIS
jgi:predicted nucleotidyltransferase component of viral defense system